MALPDSTSRTAAHIERIALVLRQHEGSHGLNPAQWTVLRYLAKANRFSRSPTAVAEFMAATKGTVSQTLISLQKKGLVAKTVRAADKRSVCIEVTPAALARLESEDPMQRLLAPLAELPPLHTSLMSQALSRVLGTMLVEADRRNFGDCTSCQHLQVAADDDAHPSERFCGFFREPLAEAELTQSCVAFEPD